MNKIELDRTLAGHKQWLAGGKTGKRADFRGANLIGANLIGASLRGANLIDANLAGANLTDAIFIDADLRGADLERAELRGADFERARLMGTILCSYNLNNATMLFRGKLVRIKFEVINK